MSLPPRPLLLALALAALTPAASAQTPRPSQGSPTDGPPAAADTSGTAPADVRLDVDRLVVDSLVVKADSVRARLDLDASVGGLLTVRAGLTVEVDGAEVEVQGVEAAADLRIQLDTVARVLMEALRVVRESPELVRGAASAAPGGAAPSGAVPGGGAGLPDGAP